MSGLVGSAAGGASIRTATGAAAAAGGGGVKTINGQAPDGAGNIAETLASLYAFGLADGANTDADNTFAGPNYAAHFPLGAGGLGILLYESAAHQADTEIPADTVARYLPGGGATTFRGDMAVWNGWPGSLGSISGMTFWDDKVFTNDPTPEWPDWHRSFIAGIETLATSFFQGYDNQLSSPSPYPPPVSASGQRQVSLTNDQIGFGGLSITERLNGWGQHSTNLQPNRSGIVPQEITYQNGRIFGRNAGDGTGWLLYDDDINHGGNQVGLLSFRCTDTANDRWAWAFSVAAADVRDNGMKTIMTIGPDVVDLPAGSTMGGVPIATA